MRKQILIAAGCLVLAGTAPAQDAKPGAKEPFKNENEKISYAIGMTTALSLSNNVKNLKLDMNVDTVAKAFQEGLAPNIPADTALRAVAVNSGMNLNSALKRVELDADLAALNKAVRDGLSGAPMLLTEMEMRQVLTKFQQELGAKQHEKQVALDKAEAEKNKKAGEAFLAANRTKDGVKSLPSGLQYKVLAEGKGESPKSTDRVKVNYRGTLLDGTEFDSSYKRGQPTEFGVTQVIAGWTEALEMMKPGAKWQLFIPSNIAYGDSRHPPIPPGSTLIFEVELVSIAAPSAAGTPAAPTQPLTSDIIKVPSAEELKKGAKIETIKPEDIEKERAKELGKAKP